VGQKKKSAQGSAQVFEKARFGQGNPSVFLGFIWLGLGWILLDLAKFGFGLD
jgi:hypothetical protein